MTTRLSQRYVAISLIGTVSRKVCTNYNPVCTRLSRQNNRRWQSTTSKTVIIPNDKQPDHNRHEIPSDCFVEASAYAEPSLNRIENPTKVDLNTTRPATLDSPSALQRSDYPDGSVPIGDRAKYLFKLGKSFLVFYKTGLKNVWANAKQYRSLRSRFQGQALNAIGKYGGQTIEGKPIPTLSRSEYQLCLRAKHDILKMLPFSLVFIICGEFTPLVIIALGSSIVPYTCRIPRQEQKDLQKRVLQDKNYMEDLPRLHSEIETPLETPDWQMEHLEAYRLGLTSLRTPIPVLGAMYHSLLTRPKLMRHCDNIVADSLLIHREGGAFRLSHQDIFEWANSYGLYALRQWIEDCQKNGQDPRNEKIKTELFPKIDAEIQYMLHDVADWSKLKPSEQWRIGLRTVGSTSPDWQARVRDMREQWRQG